jgi:hypothetical protein
MKRIIRRRRKENVCAEGVGMNEAFAYCFDTMKD